MLVGMRNVQGGEMRELTSSDDEGWQEREASRTHSVKFTDEPPEADKEVYVYLFFLSFCIMLLCNTLFYFFLFYLSLQIDSICTSKYTTSKRIES